MNLILFTESEVTKTGEEDHFTVTVPETDRRYIHCTTVLKIDSASVCRIGIIGGLMYNAPVTEISATSLTFTFSSCNIRATKPMSDLNISLILAMPRPKVLDRMWAVIAQLGFRRVILINAERVETSYFHTHVIREDNYMPKLVKGLEQAAVSTRLPDIAVDKRSLDVFLSKRLDVAFPLETTNRFICHPADPAEEQDGMKNVFDTSKETVIALGPEGGWLDPEIDELRNRGFVPVTCSSRIFTTDVALIALTAAITSRLDPKLLGGLI